MGRIIYKNGKKYVKTNHNGEDICYRYKDPSDKKSFFKVRYLIYLALFYFGLTVFDTEKKYPGLIPHKLILKDLTKEEIVEEINKSNNLTEEEKEYLCNEDFLEDILPYINKNVLTRYYFDDHIHDINIESYDEEHSWHKNSIGYYTLTTPRTLHIKDYECIDDYNKDTISHEYVHLCQMPVNREILIEACAEIISSEYFEDTFEDTYTTEVILVRELMEIIGPEPIWYYNFTNDFSMIEESVKPYLTVMEYNDFLKFRTYSNDSREHNDECIILQAVLEKLYKNKYGDDLQNNEIINGIKNRKNFSRYYFNDRKKDLLSSYYYNRELQVVPTFEAYKNKDIFFYIDVDDIIPKERVIDLFTVGNKFAGRVYGYKDGSFKEINSICDVREIKDNPDIYSFYTIRGKIYVSYESYCKNYSDNPNYKYESPYGYIKSLDVNGNTEYYKYVKKYIPLVEDKSIKKRKLDKGR